MALARCSGTIIRHIIKNAGLQSTDCMLNPLIYAPQGVRYKKKILQVILTTDMEKLGKAGEIVKVAPGYFRNYLMPKFLAVPNIDKFAYLVHEQRKLFLTDKEKEKPDEEVDRSEEERLKEYQRAAIRLENAILGVRRYTNHDGELRRPMTKRMITDEVAKQLRVSIEPENLHLPGPLTRIGEYRVPLLLPMSIPLPPGKTGWSLKLRIRHKPCLWVRHLPPAMRDRACAVRLPLHLQRVPATKVV